MNVSLNEHRQCIKWRETEQSRSTWDRAISANPTLLLLSHVNHRNAHRQRCSKCIEGHYIRFHVWISKKRPGATTKRRNRSLKPKSSASLAHEAPLCTLIATKSSLHHDVELEELFTDTSSFKRIPHQRRELGGKMCAAPWWQAKGGAPLDTLPYVPRST
jgi:hypothetical protein